MSYRVELHCLHWPNVSDELVALHKKCFDHIGVRVTYTVEPVQHALWIERLLKERLPKLDAIGFVDIDCLAYSKAAVEEAIGYVKTSGSFLGLGQSSGPLPTRVYAAPAFLVISRHAYEVLGRPDMREGPDGDVAQGLSTAADRAGFRYRVLYPIGFYRPNAGALWQVGTFGHYGQGTEYQGGFFHNFNSRTNEGLDLFRERANAILAGEAQPTVLPYMSQSLALELPQFSESRPATISARAVLAYQRTRHRLSPHVPAWARKARSWLRRAR